jgi:prevent-host-death family protein
MDPKNTLPISEARKKIFEIAEEVQKPNKYYVLTEKGRPKAVIMSAELFDSWAETLEVLQEFPSLGRDFQEAEADYRNHNYITLEALLAKQGFVLAEKPKQAYAVPSRYSKKSPKRSGKNR